MNKKLIVLLLIVSLLFSSCATKSLWNNSYYQESIENFLISEDNKQLVILGEKYDYIFEIDEKLKEILTSKYKKNIIPVFDTFRLDEFNNIVGEYALFYEVKKYYDFKTKKEVQKKEQWLKKHDFDISDRQFYFEKLVYKRKSVLKGKRYLSNKAIKSTNKFNNKYYINIDEGKFENNAAIRLTMTPITIAADGILTISTIVLLSFVAQAGAGVADVSFITDTFREDNYNKNLYRTEFNEKKLGNNLVKVTDKIE